MAADLGVPNAQYQMFLEYVQGVAVKPDQAKAVAWLQKSADQKFSEDQFYLGLMYLTGEIGENETEKGKALILEAAEQGYPVEEVLAEIRASKKNE